MFSKLVPGDFFGIRTLIPNDEIHKRYKPDPEDKKRVALKRTVTKKATLGNYHYFKDPIF